MKERVAASAQACTATLVRRQEFFRGTIIEHFRSIFGLAAKTGRRAKSVRCQFLRLGVQAQVLKSRLVVRDRLFKCRQPCGENFYAIKIGARFFECAIKFAFYPINCRVLTHTCQPRVLFKGVKANARRWFPVFE